MVPSGDLAGTQSVTADFSNTTTKMLIPVNKNYITRALEQHGSRRSAAKLSNTHTYGH